MRNEEEIVEIERKRIARDLHDTVSQEFVCSQYDLSGVAAQALELEKSQIQQQLNGVSDILGTAQNDLSRLAPTSSSYRIGRKKFGRRDGDDF